MDWVVDGLAVDGLAGDGLPAAARAAAAGATARVSWMAEVAAPVALWMPVPRWMAVVPAGAPGWPARAAALAEGEALAGSWAQGSAAVLVCATREWGSSIPATLNATREIPAKMLAAGAPAVRILMPPASGGSRGAAGFRGSRGGAGFRGSGDAAGFRGRRGAAGSRPAGQRPLYRAGAG